MSNDKQTITLTDGQKVEVDALGLKAYEAGKKMRGILGGFARVAGKVAAGVTHVKNVHRVIDPSDMIGEAVRKSAKEVQDQYDASALQTRKLYAALEQGKFTEAFAFGTPDEIVDQLIVLGLKPEEAHAKVQAALNGQATTTSPVADATTAQAQPA